MASSFQLLQASEQHLSVVLPMVNAYHSFEQLATTHHQRESAVQTLLCNRALGGIWLICCDDEPVGYLAICIGFAIEFGGHDAFVDEFYVRPEYRGRGLGATALEQIKIEARDLGIKALHLEVSKTNTQARQLYSRAQFQAREKYVLMSVEL